MKYWDNNVSSTYTIIIKLIIREWENLVKSLVGDHTGLGQEGLVTLYTCKYALIINQTYIIGL